MSGRKGQAERGVGREVTAKELAGAQINANEGGQWGEARRGAVLSDKGSPTTENAQRPCRRH